LAPVLGGAALDEQWKVHRTRALQREQLESIVADWCAQRSSADVVAALEPQGVPVGTVNPPWWARHDAHIAQRGTLEHLRHPDRDEPTRWLGPTLPIRFSRASSDTGPAEPLGASTDAVLRELLDLDDAAMQQLRERGALG
jgi:crotonobetainyl-CoA:carnitine CoA-transferase CaiB-like acyl-CoA transferase